MHRSAGADTLEKTRVSETVNGETVDGKENTALHLGR